MKAQPNDFATFGNFLERLSRFGNCQSKEEAEHAAEVLKVFRLAAAGVIGRTCACGSEGTKTRPVQPVPQWPNEAHVFCDEHAKLIDQYEALMKKIIAEENGKK